MDRDLSIDSICRGEIVLAQPRRGYRFNVDSVILADFAGVVGRPVERAVDLGAGCGVVGLLLARRGLAQQMLLVEIQQELVEAARENIRHNGLEGRVDVVHGDLRQPGMWLASSAQLVVSNPPFFRRGTGLVSSHPQVALARHEVTCTLEDLVQASAGALEPGGSLVMIHAEHRLDEARQAMKRHGLKPRTVRRVRPLPDRRWSRALLQGIVGGEEPEEELPPLLIETTPGVYSPELARILGDR